MNKDARVSMKDACETLRSVERSLNSSLSAVQDQNMQNKLKEQLGTLHKISKECENIALGISTHG